MAEAPHAKEAGGKRPKKQVRPVRTSVVGVLPVALGLALALLLVAFLYAGLQRAGRGDYEYWSEYQRIAPQLHGAGPAKADEVWTLVYSLPQHKITEPMLRELHNTLLEYATAIRDPDGFKKRGPELRARMGYFESEIPEKRGAIVKGPK